MESLYNIEQDMIALYDKIEEQGGEILPEDEQALAINHENFMNKMEGYNHYLHKLDNDISACKAEEDRIKSLRKRMESRRDAAKKNVLSAVQNFGVPTKTGGYAVEFATFKFSTRRSESVVEDEKRLEYLNKELNRFIYSLYDNGMLNPDINLDLQGLCDSINANIKAEMESDGCSHLYIPFTPNDLYLINIDVKSSCKLFSLFTTDNGVAQVLCKGATLSTELNVDKTTAKNYLKATQDVNIISCCHKEVNYSLQMK